MECPIPRVTKISPDLLFGDFALQSAGFASQSADRDFFEMLGDFIGMLGRYLAIYILQSYIDLAKLRGVLNLVNLLKFGF